MDVTNEIRDRYLTVRPTVSEILSVIRQKEAPALLGELHSYDGMLVANGGDAQRAFTEIISPNTPAGKKDKLREALLDYCKKTLMSWSS